MTRILVLGRSGQVARALAEKLPEAVFAGRDEADFMKPETVLECLEKHQPEIIINAVAYTAVDKAESEELAAIQVNALTPGLIAEWCARKGALLIHYSTDYVFDGSGDTPWKETDKTSPLSAYGRSKLLGETEIARAKGRHVILRLCWVYDASGKNFLNTMLRLGAEREELSVVADQIGAPSFASDIAEATLKIIATPKAASGIYHFANGGETSWHGFATAIFAEARNRGASLMVKMVKPIATKDYPTPAKRPSNSRLDTAKFRAAFGWQDIPGWRDALARAMHDKFVGKP